MNIKRKNISNNNCDDKNDKWIKIKLKYFSFQLLDF